MGTSLVEPVERTDIVQRVLRFTAWFGMVYGLLELVQLTTWRFLVRWIGTVPPLNYPPQFVCRAIIDLCAVWLLAGCIAVLRGRPRGRGILFVWAVFVLGVELIYEGTQIRSMSYLGMVIELPGMPLELGFPMMVLCITGMRETVRATTEHGGGAFAVVIDSAPSGPPTSRQSRDVFCRDLRRCIAWVGLLMGLCGVVYFGIQASYGNLSHRLPYVATRWRAQLLAIVTTLAAYSWPLLLGAAILMLLGRSAGRRWLLGWAILYLLLALAGGALYDAMYIYWVATKPHPELQSTPVIAAVYLFSELRNCAFAIMSVYLLQQPGISVADGGPRWGATTRGGNECRAKWFMKRGRGDNFWRQRTMRQKWVARFVAVMVVGMMAFVAGAQPTPATQPATQPGRGARGPRGASGAASKYPREQIPFTNSRIANLDPNLPTLFICGDSTAAQNGNDIQRGWGAMLVDYFDTSKVNLVNFSQAGITFPAYYASRWPQVVAALKPGDFVVVELGHNSGHMNGMGDETREQPGRGGGPATIVHTYGWYIRTFIRDARAKGATAIVSTTTTRNMWNNPNATFRDGTILTQEANYNPAEDRVERAMGQPMDNSMWSWAHQVADEEKVPLIDHNIITADVYDKMGREAVGKLFIQDHTHTTTDGATLNTETFLMGLRAQPDIKLNEFLNDKGKAIQPHRMVVKRTGGSL